MSPEDRQRGGHEFPRDAAAPLAIWSGLFLMDAVLWSRWFAGALTNPLTATVAWSSSGLVASASIAALILWRRLARPLWPRVPYWPELLALALPILWGVVIGRGTSPFALGGLAALWGMSLVAVGLAHLWTEPDLFADTTSDGVSPPTGCTRRFESDDEHATQWQRRVACDGGELIEGCARVDFGPGQKEAVMHLAFCPPLSAVPVVHGEDADGGELEIRAEAVHTFGARLAVRRRSRIESSETRFVSYVAVPPGQHDAAA